MAKVTDILSESRDIRQKKASEKSGGLFSAVGAVVPDSIVIEQASGDRTAGYAAGLLRGAGIIADLTGGLGVNSYHFSRRAGKVFCVEIDTDRANALHNNFKVAGIGNVEVVNADCVAWLESESREFDAVFVDPSRRAGSGKRLISLKDCSPDIDILLPLLRGRTPRMLVKVSPLLDISLLFKSYQELTGISIVEDRREVKELLLDFNLSGHGGMRYVRCVAFSHTESPKVYEYDYDSDAGVVSGFLHGLDGISSGGFVYEPSPSQMKASMFGRIASAFPGLKKLAPNTHLFYSDSLFKDFPGRTFRISRSMTSRDLKQLKGKDYNVISRNHPVKAAELAQRFRLRPSEEHYLIACKAGNEKIILEAEKI